jgi:NADH-quinone oxidoreductase subunit G
MNEFLLANHPLRLSRLRPAGGECELQEMSFDWGVLEERFTEQKNYYPEKFLSPMVANGLAALHYVQTLHARFATSGWAREARSKAGGRGAHTVIGTYLGWLDCSQCATASKSVRLERCSTRTYRHQRVVGVGPNDLDLQLLLGRPGADVARHARAAS